MPPSLKWVFCAAEHLGVSGRHLLGTGTIEMFTGDVLAGVAVKELQVGLGHRFISVFAGIPVHNRHRRFGQDANRWDHNFHFVGSEFFDGEVGLIFPRDENVADAALDETWWWRRERRNPERGPA
jgi:hypothetical protein